MLGLAFPALDAGERTGRVGDHLWGAFLYWWAGIIYAIETVPRHPHSRVADEPRSDTLEQGG